MIKVESKKLSSEESKILAGITISARKGTPLESNRTVEDVARGIEDLSTNDSFQLLIASDENGDIVGWTHYYVVFRLMDFISGFFPLVKESSESEKIALSLIEAAKRIEGSVPTYKPVCATNHDVVQRMSTTYIHYIQVNTRDFQ